MKDARIEANYDYNPNSGEILCMAVKAILIKSPSLIPNFSSQSPIISRFAQAAKALIFNFFCTDSTVTEESFLSGLTNATATIKPVSSSHV